MTERESNAKVADLFLKTDIHGLPEFYEAPTTRLKVTWAVIVVVTVTILAVELKEAFKDFVENPITTTFDVVGTTDGLTFPQIYICPLNAISQQELLVSNVDKTWTTNNVDGLLSAATNLTDLDGLLAKGVRLSEALSSLGLSAPGAGAADRGAPWVPDTIQQYFLRVGYALNDFIRQASFHTTSINVTQKATAIFDADYGKCFLLNINQSQVISGVGLKLVIDLNYDTAYEADSNRMTIFDGVMLGISNNFNPTVLDMIHLAPATANKILLKLTQFELLDRTKVQRLLGKSKRCKSDEEGRATMKVLNIAYSQTTCISDCAHQLALQHCGCFLPIDRRFLLYPEQTADVCSAMKMNGCVRSQLSGNLETMRQCSKECLPACSRSVYDPTVNSSPFPSKRFVSKLAAGVSSVRPDATALPSDEWKRLGPLVLSASGEDDRDDKLSLTSRRKRRRASESTPWITDQKLINGDFIIADIAFSNLQYTKITQHQSMTFTTLVGNIGGLVGLWVGASIVSLIKLLFVVIPFCLAPLLGWRRRKRTPEEADDNSQRKLSAVQPQRNWIEEQVFYV